MQQVRFELFDQRLRIEALQPTLLFAAKHLAVARADIEFRTDRKQAVVGAAGMQFEQGAPRLDHLGQPGNLALTQLIATGTAQ